MRLTRNRQLEPDEWQSRSETFGNSSLVAKGLPMFAALLGCSHLGGSASPLNSGTGLPWSVLESRTPAHGNAARDRSRLRSQFRGRLFGARRSYGGPRRRKWVGIYPDRLRQGGWEFYLALAATIRTL